LNDAPANITILSIERDVNRLVKAGHVPEAVNRSSRIPDRAPPAPGGLFKPVAANNRASFRTPKLRSLLQEFIAFLPISLSARRAVSVLRQLRVNSEIL
jgi:hypothetical protein